MYVEILTKPFFLACLCQAACALLLHPSLPWWWDYHKQRWKTLAFCKWHITSILVTKLIYCLLLSWSHAVLQQQAVSQGTATSTRSVATLFHHVMQIIMLARHISYSPHRTCWEYLLHHQRDPILTYKLFHKHYRFYRSFRHRRKIFSSWPATFFFYFSAYSQEDFFLSMQSETPNTFAYISHMLPFIWFCLAIMHLNLCPSSSVLEPYRQQSKASAISLLLTPSPPCFFFLALCGTKIN